MLLIALPVAIAKKERVVRRQLALGYVFIAAWVLAGPAAAQIAGVGKKRDSHTVAGRLGTLGVIVGRRGKLTATQLATLTGLLIFAWLAETDGTFVDVAGRLLGLSGSLILIIGVALTLLGDSEFVQNDGKLMPQRARPLLWVGYIGMSLTLTLLAAPAFVLNSGPFAFRELAWPLALWLVITGRMVPRPEKAESGPKDAEGKGEPRAGEQAQHAREAPPVGRAPEFWWKRAGQRRASRRPKSLAASSLPARRSSRLRLVSGL